MEFVFQRSYRGPLKAVILDWAGTTMDYGCYAPAVVFIEVYKRKGVPISIEEARLNLIEKKLPEAIMVDCSHGNSMKKYQGQAIVWRNVIDQYIAGNDAIFGLMLESNLHEGNQKFSGDIAALRYGVSITDECISWETTEHLLLTAAEKLINSSKRNSSDRWVNAL